MILKEKYNFGICALQFDEVVVQLASSQGMSNSSEPRVIEGFY